MDQLVTKPGYGLDEEAPTRNTPMVALGLTVSYGEKPAVIGINAHFPAGSMTAINGPNCSRKFTLLTARPAMVPRNAGDVQMFGKPLVRQMHRLAYVPQRASVDWDFPTRVIDVVLMGMYRELGLLRPIRKHHREKAFACLERVAMADFADRQI